MRWLVTILLILFCAQLSAQIRLTEKQLIQLDSLVKDFDTWYAEQTKPKKKWYSFDISDVGMIAVGAIGGGCRGINQAILFRDYKQGDPFWDYKISYKRKYADYDNGDMSAAFPGSKTILVGFTDGYHGTRLGETMCYIGGALCIAFSDIKNYDKPLLAIAKKLLLYGIANGIMFKVTYK